jgi:hypothetical protein
MAQKRLSVMADARAENAFSILFQQGAVALPNHPLERTGDSVGFLHAWLSRRSPATHRQRSASS